MVQLSSPTVSSQKNIKMGKKKTPKKGSVDNTPAKPVLKAPEQAKTTPATATLQTPKMNKKASLKEVKCTPKAAALQAPKIKKKSLVKEQMSTPKAAALQTPKSHIGMKEISLKKAKITPEAASKTSKIGTPSVKKLKKTKAPKLEKPVIDVEMASDGEEETAPAKSFDEAKPSAKKATSVGSASPAELGKFCLFVKGLHYESEQDKVFKHFQQFGTVKRCSVPCNPNQSNQIKGFGFIEYNSQEDMDKALAAAHTLDSRTLLVRVNKAEKEVAGKRKRDESQQPGGDKKRQMPKFDHQLFVGKLKYTTTTNSIQKHFSQFGEVINIGLPMKNKTGNKGFAFVAFKEASSLKKALAKSDQQIDETNIVLSAEKNSAAKVVPRPSLSFPNELFVGGLNPSTEKPTLEQHFSKYGKVVNVTLPWNKEGSRNKGFGFVSFESYSSLEEAMKEDHEIDGKLIGTRIAKKTEENGASSQKTKTKEVKATPALEKMEDDSEEEEDDSEEGDEKDEESDSEDGDVESAASQKTKFKKVKVACAVEKVEDDSEEDEEEGVDAEEGVEDEEADSEDDEEVEGESDEAEDEAVENDDEEDESDEDGDDDDE